MMKRRLRSISEIYRISVFRYALCAMLFASLCACATTVEITDHTVQAGKMKAGQSYTAPMDGWFVSDEGVSKILRAIEYYKFKWQECEAVK